MSHRKGVSPFRWDFHGVAKGTQPLPPLSESPVIPGPPPEEAFPYGEGGSAKPRRMREKTSDFPDRPVSQPPPEEAFPYGEGGRA